MSSSAPRLGSLGTANQVHLVGIVGGPKPVANSLSPFIHNAAFEAMDLDWIYAAFPVTGDTVKAVRGLVGNGVRGLNVTMPYKVAATEAMDELDPSAAGPGCINTIQVLSGRLIGHNTDGQGLVRFLERDAGFVVAGKTVALLGAGGAARSVAVALAEAGIARITVAARDRAQGELVANLVSVGQVQPIEGYRAVDVDLVINATPLVIPPIDFDAITSSVFILDMAYRPVVTPLMRLARERGAITHGGLGMLLHQACLSFEIWTGIQPPINVMSAAAVATLSG